MVTGSLEHPIWPHWHTLRGDDDISLLERHRPRVKNKRLADSHVTQRHQVIKETPERAFDNVNSMKK